MAQRFFMRLQVKVVLGSTFRMIGQAPVSIMQPVQRHLRFSKHLMRLADQIVSEMADKTGCETFNGVHFRLEYDMEQFMKKQGNEFGAPRKYHGSFSCISGTFCSRKWPVCSIR